MTRRILAALVAAATLVPHSARAPFTTDTTPAGLLCVDRNGEICPNRLAMRAYRVSKMSDEDIRAARLWAGEEFQKTLERARKEAADRVQRFAAQQKFCEDIVYKTRNPAACSWPLNWPHLGEPTIDMTESQLFESRLLGICALLETAKEARENDCLPKAEQ